MTVRGCLIGDSHLVALRTAYRRDPGRWPGLALDFFASPSSGLAELEYRRGALRATTDLTKQNLIRLNGLRYIPIIPYDFVAVVGCGLSIATAMALYRSFRVIGMPSIGVPTSEQPLQERIISKSAASATLSDTLALKMGMKIATQVAAKRGRVLLIEQPRPSEACMIGETPQYRAFRRIHRNSDGIALSLTYQHALTEVSRQIGDVLLQPANTITDGIFTKRVFSEGSMRLFAGKKIAHSSSDHLHANAEYGALVLDQLATDISSRV